MTDHRNAEWAAVIDSFEKTYRDFLVEERMLAVPPTRLGFIMAALKEVKGEPHPNEDFQEFMLGYLDSERMKAEKDTEEFRKGITALIQGL